MPLFTAIGTALGASAASAFGTGALVTGLTAASAVPGIMAATSRGGGSSTSFNMPELPQSPSTSNAAAQARSEAQRRRRSMSRSESIYTSPLGISGQANIARRTLLGQ